MASLGESNFDLCRLSCCGQIAFPCIVGQRSDVWRIVVAGVGDGADTKGIVGVAGGCCRGVAADLGRFDM